MGINFSKQSLADASIIDRSLHRERGLVHFLAALPNPRQPDVALAPSLPIIRCDTLPPSPPCLPCFSSLAAHLLTLRNPHLARPALAHPPPRAPYPPRPRATRVRSAASAILRGHLPARHLADTGEQVGEADHRLEGLPLSQPDADPAVRPRH